MIDIGPTKKAVPTPVKALKLSSRLGCIIPARVILRINLKTNSMIVAILQATPRLGLSVALAIWLMVELSPLATAVESAPGGQRPVLVPPHPNSGFRNPYLLLLPEEILPAAPFLILTPTPPTSRNATDYLEAAGRLATNARPFLARLRLPILIPVLPRPPVRLPGGHHINLHMPALSRAALLAAEPEFARIDLQVLAMLDDARVRVLREHSLRTHERAIFAGFSAAGHFATRMAVLHPSRVLAVWAGGTGGHPILPLAELGGHTLTYPVGVNDLAQVAGAVFDARTFARIPILIVQGAADTNTSLPSGEEPSDSYSAEQARLVLGLVGTNAVQRLERVKALYCSAGSEAEIRVYEGVGHRMSPEVARDLVEFVAQQADRARRSK